MKNTALFTMFVLFFTVLHSVSFSGQGHPFLYGDNDSLLFDSDEDNAGLIHLTDNMCRIVVNYAQDATGNVLRQKIEPICGIPDTAWILKENVKLKQTDMLEEGSTIKTGPNGEVSVLLVSGNSNADYVAEFALGPNSTMQLPHLSDLCRSVSSHQEPGPLGFYMKGGKLYYNLGPEMNKIMTDYKNFGHDAGLFIFHTGQSIIDHINTELTIDISVSGSDTTDVLKVYEGSATVKCTKSSGSHPTGEDAQKLMEDYRNGKITAEEMQKKLKELTQNLETSANDQLPVTVDAGSKCTSLNGKMNVEPIESGDDHWWESIMNK